MAAQDLRRNRVKGAEPRHAFGDRAGQHGDAILHLPRGLVGEGHGENFGRPRPALRDDMRDPRRQDPRFAGARPGQHEHRTVQRLDRDALLGVQPLEVSGARPPPPSPARRRRPAAAPGLRDQRMRKDRSNRCGSCCGFGAARRIMRRPIMRPFGGLSTIGRLRLEGAMRRSVGTFPPASPSKLLQSITFVILDRIDPKS